MKVSFQYGTHATLLKRSPGWLVMQSAVFSYAETRNRADAPPPFAAKVGIDESGAASTRCSSNKTRTSPNPLSNVAVEQAGVVVLEARVLGSWRATATRGPACARTAAAARVAIPARVGAAYRADREEDREERDHSETPIRTRRFHAAPPVGNREPSLGLPFTEASHLGTPLSAEGSRVAMLDVRNTAGDCAWPWKTLLAHWAHSGSKLRGTKCYVALGVARRGRLFLLGS